MSNPDVSLVIPAWNEEDLLPALLDSVDAAKACYRGDVEVIVADNVSTDRTAVIARERGCRMVTAKATSSTRKLDEYGDWRYSANLFRSGYWYFRAKTALREWGQDYWYRGR